MIQTVTHDGWIGIAPSGKKINMRSLDFWCIEDGKIRDNWVMGDILDAYRQLGVDVLQGYVNSTRFAYPAVCLSRREPRDY